MSGAYLAAFLTPSWAHRKHRTMFCSRHTKSSCVLLRCWPDSMRAENGKHWTKFRMSDSPHCCSNQFSSSIRLSELFNTLQREKSTLTTQVNKEQLSFPMREPSERLLVLLSCSLAKASIHVSISKGRRWEANSFTCWLDEVISLIETYPACWMSSFKSKFLFV